MIILYYLCFLYCSLRHFDINLKFNYLTFWCKPTVSECLFDICLIEALNLQGRLAPQQFGTNIQGLTSYM